MDSVLKITQAYSMTPWRKQLQRVVTITVVVVLTLVGAILYIDVSAERATLGREIQDMQDDLAALEQNIADKQSKLATITSAVEMEERARALGFVALAPGDAEFIYIAEYAGRGLVELAAPSTPEVVNRVVLSPEYTMSLTDWVRQQLYLPAVP